jgi:hypothetical protein
MSLTEKAPGTPQPAGLFVAPINETISNPRKLLSFVFWMVSEALHDAFDALLFLVLCAGALLAFQVGELALQLLVILEPTFR